MKCTERQQEGPANRVAKQASRGRMSDEDKSLDLLATISGLEAEAAALLLDLNERRSQWDQKGGQTSLSSWNDEAAAGCDVESSVELGSRKMQEKRRYNPDPLAVTEVRVVDRTWQDDESDSDSDSKISGGSVDSSSLHAACEQLDVLRLRSLLSKACPIDTPDSRTGVTPLFLVVQNVSLSGETAATLPILKLLLTARASVERKSSCGVTPLDLVEKLPTESAVRQLVCDAHVDLFDSLKTPLDS